MTPGEHQELRERTKVACAESFRVLEECQAKIRRLLAEEAASEYDDKAVRHLIWLTNETMRLGAKMARI